MDSRHRLIAVFAVTLLWAAPLGAALTQSGGASRPGALASGPAPRGANGTSLPGAVETAVGDGVCRGTIESPANGTTVVSIQGARGANKRPARLVAFGPNGDIEWMRTVEGVWSYDVDPMRNSHLFVTATLPGQTSLFVVDPVTGERIWEVTLNMTDTHDADLIDGGERILVANMRNYDEVKGTNEDRILVYDRSKGKIVWQWQFADHYPRSVGGNYTDDWSHVNDVDRIGEGRYLVSPRNFDQVIVVDRSSGEVAMQLGENANGRILRQQHNPDYLETDGGKPTMLVADSGNDRIVEYTRENGDWTRTWSLGNSSVLAWPRDADRLPNGNTLVTDSRNHRVFEVTPEGEIVWEVYTPWLPYDAERVRYGGSSHGPTMADLNAGASPPLHGSAGGHENPSTLERCAAAIRNTTNQSVSLTVDPYTRSNRAGDASGTADGGNTTDPRFGVFLGLAAAVAVVAVIVRLRDR